MIRKPVHNHLLNIPLEIYKRIHKEADPGKLGLTKFIIDAITEKLDKMKAARKLKSIQPDGSLHDVSAYIHFDPGSDTMTLDGSFTADQLEAFAEYMRTHKGE